MRNRGSARGGRAQLGEPTAGTKPGIQVPHFSRAVARRAAIRPQSSVVCVPSSRLQPTAPDRRTREHVDQATPSSATGHRSPSTGYRSPSQPLGLHRQPLRLRRQHLAQRAQVHRQIGLPGGCQRRARERRGHDVFLPGRSRSGARSPGRARNEKPVPPRPSAAPPRPPRGHSSSRTAARLSAMHTCRISSVNSRAVRPSAQSRNSRSCTLRRPLGLWPRSSGTRTAAARPGAAANTARSDSTFWRP